MISRRNNPRPWGLIIMIILLALTASFPAVRKRFAGLLVETLTPILALSTLPEQPSLALKLKEAKLGLETLQAQLEVLSELVPQLERGSAIPALVLARPPQSPYDTLLIDYGEKRGAAIGDRVYAGEIIIGEVQEVFPTISRVVLFSSPGNSQEIYFESNKIAAFAKGLGGGNLMVELPRGIEIANDSLVSLARLAEAPFGRVGAISARPANAFQNITVRLLTNINNLRWLTVRK